MIGIALAVVGSIGLGYIEARRQIARATLVRGITSGERDAETDDDDETETDDEAEAEAGGYPGGLDGETLRAGGDQATRTQMIADVFISELRPFLSGAPGRHGGALYETWAIMVAHHALETTNKNGEWFKAFVYNTSNTCGLNAVAGQPYVVARDSDGTDHKFRKFVNVNECVREYISLIRRRYPDGWTAALAGDPVGYAAGLKSGDKGQAYYGAPLGDFTSGLKARWRRINEQSPAWGYDE
jgi:hypothetical protein